ncbi:hypothetical protein PYCC9005_005527 [Savitreella phatthalungensis]
MATMTATAVPAAGATAAESDFDRMDAMTPQSLSLAAERAIARARAKLELVDLQLANARSSISRVRSRTSVGGSPATTSIKSTATTAVQTTPTPSPRDNVRNSLMSLMITRSDSFAHTAELRKLRDELQIIRSTLPQGGEALGSIDANVISRALARTRPVRPPRPRAEQIPDLKILASRHQEDMLPPVTPRKQSGVMAFYSTPKGLSYARPSVITKDDPQLSLVGLDFYPPEVVTVGGIDRLREKNQGGSKQKQRYTPDARSTVARKTPIEPDLALFHIPVFHTTKLSAHERGGATRAVDRRRDSELITNPLPRTATSTIQPLGAFRSISPTQPVPEPIAEKRASTVTVITDDLLFSPRPTFESELFGGGYARRSLVLDSTASNDGVSPTRATPPRLSQPANELMTMQGHPRDLLYNPPRKRSDGSSSSEGNTATGSFSEPDHTRYSLSKTAEPEIVEPNAPKTSPPEVFHEFPIGQRQSRIRPPSRQQQFIGRLGSWDLSAGSGLTRRPSSRLEGRTPSGIPLPRTPAKPGVHSAHRRTQSALPQQSPHAPRSDFPKYSPYDENDDQDADIVSANDVTIETLLARAFTPIPERPRAQVIVPEVDDVTAADLVARLEDAIQKLSDRLNDQPYTPPAENPQATRLLAALKILEAE